MTSSPQRSSTHMSSPHVATAGLATTGPALASTRGPSHGQAPSQPPQSQARVQFHDDVQFLDDEAKSGVLVACETSHPGGVIAPLVRGLSALKLEVHKIESKLSDGVRSERLWVSAPDGAPLSQRRQGLLRTAVFQALESMNEQPPDELTA
jgi:hypothetical protein